MRQEQIIMGTPVIIEINDKEARQEFFDEVFDYFKYVDEKFSTYKDTSEITAINKKEIAKDTMSDDMKKVFELSEQTKKLTGGYFDIVTPDGSYDPSGLVKGWSIFNASEILKNHGVKNFTVEAGGDIQTSGKNENGNVWCIGIQNPFSQKKEIIKKIYVSDEGIATSGNYVRGNHIYNPKDKNDIIEDISSLTVIGPNIFEADRFATSAYAMGKEGIYFIEKLDGFEAYMIDKNGIATMTTNFNNYTKQ
ncbi:MAG: FAD:protein FMN transferase [Candidatus Nomurabacteria bacterium]|nr:FAD:protein FMN transferase [Candidatus Nomurabacteria bacterium]